MNDERFDHWSTGVHTEPLDSSLPPWDPAEELACLLQEAHNDEYRAAVPQPRQEEPVTAPPVGSPMRNLHDMTAELPPVRRTRRGHRKLSERHRPDAVRVASYVLAALAAVTVSMVSVFSGVVTYQPLLLVTTAHHTGTSSAWWPMLVYGPWMAGSLSVLRAALHQRRAVHSWFVVLLFSSVAVLLCVVQAPRTIADTAAAALPGVAALTCFQQLVRQITLTRPPRRTVPRHRQRPAEHPATPKPAGDGQR
ncbi:hypothetical protein AB0M97_20475 [Streptomyces sp. NPDC051207]|uniref:hypothetical protein n=1 Tax=Streptomyces sp. NPDC051207 TaxID=3154641 RepID=UPI00342F7DB4